MHSIHKAFYNSLYNISSFETRDIYISSAKLKGAVAVQSNRHKDIFGIFWSKDIYNSITMIKNLIIIFESK